jgi:hypothetical protein
MSSSNLAPTAALTLTLFLVLFSTVWAEVGNGHGNAPGVHPAVQVPQVKQNSLKTTGTKDSWGRNDESPKEKPPIRKNSNRGIQ